MSFAAERYARAQWPSLKGDAKALAVLKEIAYWYIDDKGRCTGLSQSDLAKLTGYAKPDAIGAAIKTLVSKGLLVVQKRYAENGNVLGSDYLLPLFVREEWPEDRQGKDVFLLRAPKQGVTPCQGGTPEKEGAPCKGVGYPLRRGTVPPVKGEGTPCEGGGYPLKGETRTGIGQGLDRDRTGNGQVVCAPASAADADEPPFPSFDEESLFEDTPPTADEIEELFPDLQKATKPKTSRRKPETACPWEEGSTVPEDLSDWCKENCPSLNPQVEFDALVGHAHTHDRRCRDWKAAYRTWCKKSVLREAQQFPRSAARKGPQRLSNGSDDQYLPNSKFKRQECRDYTKRLF